MPDRAALARLLGRYRPDLSIRSLTRLGEGDFCVAWLLNGRDVVRVPKHDRATRALAREACLLAAIGDALPVAIPRPEPSSARETSSSRCTSACRVSS